MFILKFAKICAQCWICIPSLEWSGKKPAFRTYQSGAIEYASSADIPPVDSLSFDSGLQSSSSPAPRASCNFPEAC